MDIRKYCELVDTKNIFDDDNKGYRYGIYWLDNEGQEVLDATWYKTKMERFKELRRYIKEDQID